MTKSYSTHNSIKNQANIFSLVKTFSIFGSSNVEVTDCEFKVSIINTEEL